MQRLKSLALTILTAAGIASTASAAASYNFFQDGYLEGASISGMFTVDDFDNNGQIVYFGGGQELTSFMVSFSGNSVVAPFSLGLSDVYGFVWDLDSTLGEGFTGAVEGIGAASGLTSYSSGNGPNGFPGGIVSIGQVSDRSENLVVVTRKSVPDAGSTLALLGLGVTALAGLRRKQA